MKFISLLIFIFIQYAYACEVETGQSIYLLRDMIEVKSKDVIINSNCNELIKNQFNERILEYIGIVNGKYIESLINEDFPSEKIIVKNDNVNIITLNDTIRKEISEQYHFSVLKFPKKTAISLKKNDHLETICSSCEKLGKTTIQINHVRNNSIIEKYFIQVNILSEISAIKLKYNINPLTPSLNQSQFISVKLKTSTPEIYLQDLENIQFYKVIRNLKANDYLKLNDIAQINLVKAGTPLTLEYKKGRLNVISKVIPMSHGKLGDIIRLRTLDNKRIIYGKVTNFNKAEVDL
ncbi:MAG: flagellar basal body P-ring formation protein FlgA [Halobacteriovoraceae bacterium]|nr:flagellar basal body P-ring formation protein FlgA [Halobacteriovoraceae bacterium]